MRAARLVAVLTVVAVLGGGLSALALDGLVRHAGLRADYQADDLLVVLAIGSDAGPPHRGGDPMTGRADGIHLLVVDTRTYRMTIVDIPRDSAIGGSKVNAHLVLGGPARLEGELEAWSGLPIDFWVLGSFWSIEQMATGLGGIEVEVQVPMHDPFSGTALDPGAHRLDPAQALAFTRDRKSLVDGDIGRSRNQGRMMVSVLEQMRRERPALTDVLGLVQLLDRSTAHNIPDVDLLPLALTALRIEPGSIEQVTVTGPFGTIGGGSVIHPQPGDLFTRLLQGQVGPS